MLQESGVSAAWVGLRGLESAGGGWGGGQGASGTAGTGAAGAELLVGVNQGVDDWCEIQVWSGTGGWLSPTCPWLGVWQGVLTAAQSWGCGEGLRGEAVESGCCRLSLEGRRELEQGMLGSMPQ